jgi:tRNA A37 methylthiotransferase MiaB
VPEDRKEERYAALMEAQQEIALARARSAAGTTETVLVDVGASKSQPARARTRRDAPEVDAQVLVRGGPLEPGDLLDVEITGSDGYDLIARVPSGARSRAVPR